MSAPEDILSQWTALGLPGRAAPRLERVLSGGLSNRSWLVVADGGRFVLRLNGAMAMPGVDRARERRVLAAVSAAGLAPPVYLHDPDLGVLVTGFIEASGPASGPAFTSALVNLLAELHRLPDPVAEPPGYARLLDTYAERLQWLPREQAPAARAFHARMREAAASLDADRDAHVLCHHDPGPGNVIAGQDGPVLIDWEYATTGHRLFDLAVLHVDWGVPLSDLAGRGGAVTQLQATAQLYRHLCRQWTLLRRTAAPVTQ